MWGNSGPNGGLIFVGIENNGEIVGCEQCGAVHLNDLEDAARIFCQDAKVEYKRVPITNSKGHDDFLLVFRVHWRSDKVVKTNTGKAYVRSGDNKRELSEAEIRELQISKGEVHHELEPISMMYPDDFDGNLLKEFAKNVKKAKGLQYASSIGQILSQHRLGSISGSGFIPNNACCLLFAKDPLLYFPGCKIRVMRFDGEIEHTGERYNLIKDINVEGPVPKLIAEAEKAISSQLREYSPLGGDGRFQRVPEYPQTAWYEAIVNACCHRSYNLKNMLIFVKIFDDRLEITSPGGFPGTVTPENVFQTHNPRNPFLMEALRYFGFVKCANEGTKRMLEAMTENRLPAPRFGETHATTSTNVVVTLQNNHKQRRRYIDSNAAGGCVTAAVLQTLSSEDIRIINYIAEFEDITVTQAARILDREWGTAKKRLDGLVMRAILRRKARTDIKRDPKAKYVLVKQPEKSN